MPEVETKTAEPTQEELPPPTEAAAASQEGAVAAEAEAEAKPEPSGEPEVQATPWSSLTDPYEVLDLPEFRPHMERRDRRVEAALRQEYQAELAERTREWESTNLHDALVGHIGSITEKLEGADMEGAERVLTKLEKLAEPYKEEYRKSLQAKGALLQSQSVLKVLMDNLDRKGQDDLYDLASQRGVTWEALLKRYDDLKPHKETEKRVKEARQAALEEVAAQARKGLGPDLTAKQPGGGAGLTLEKYKAMSAEEAARLSPEQIDRMVQEDYQHRLRT